MKFSVEAFGISFQPGNYYREESLIQWLHGIVASLPEAEITNSSPVLFIDEANLLKKLDNPKEEEVLNNFFNWIISMVKKNVSWEKSFIRKQKEDSDSNEQFRSIFS